MLIDDLTAYADPSHPLIRTHPETHHDALYLGRRPNACVNGLRVAESEALLDQLWAHATQPALAWVHRWKAGDLVVWDNRCTRHRRDSFDPDARRVMHRAQCAGDRPEYRPEVARVSPHPRAALAGRASEGRRSIGA